MLPALPARLSPQFARGPSRCTWGPPSVHNPSSGATWGRHRQRQRACTCRGAAGRGGSGGSNGSGGDDVVERALQEAVDTLRQAQAMAQQQARAELMQSWTADGGAGAAASAGGTAAADGSSPGGAASQEAVAAFLTEQGLSGREAERLAEKLCSCNDSGSSSNSSSIAGSSLVSLAQLQAKWEGLRRVLPDADLGAMVSAEPALLSATAGDLVGAMVALVEAFPSQNVQAIAEGRPGLLLMPAQELRQRCERVVSKLLQLHPSRDREVVSEVIESNPELLIRMDYYLDAMLLDDLPVELQNMFIPPGDMGIGWLYRHYAKGGSSDGSGG